MSRFPCVIHDLPPHCLSICDQVTYDEDIATKKELSIIGIYHFMRNDDLSYLQRCLIYLYIRLQ